MTNEEKEEANQQALQHVVSISQLIGQLNYMPRDRNLSLVITNLENAQDKLKRFVGE